MSMNSLKEVNVVNINSEAQPLLKEKKADPKVKARRALSAAVVLTTIFMVAEVYGGYKAGSLAIMTDAAHLMTDIGAMLLSLFSMWLASRPPTAGMSFGFHRAEILGALASVLTIWALTGILVYEAINRIRDPEPVNGKIMFIVASGGLLINILDAFILHAGSVEHSHGGVGHGHSHGGGHGHSHGGDKKKKEGHSHDGEKKEKHGHSHDGEKKKEKKEKHGHSHDGEKKEKHGHSHDGEKKEKHGHSHDGEKKEKHGHSHDGEKKEKRKSDLLVPASSEPQEDHGHSHGDKKKKKKNEEHTNINVYSAFVHVIGDCVQSVGVMIASALIWWKPSWRLADPIVTFVFSFIVLVTTVRLLRQSISVLMEGVPQGIEAPEVQRDLETIPGVGEIHDLHIWSITVGQPALSVHLILNDPAVDPEFVLNEANHVLKDNHNIVHTTIQIEKMNNKYCENMDFHSANTRS